MVQHAIDGFEILFRLIVELFGFGLEFLETALGIDIDCILGVLADVEPLLELLRRLYSRMSMALPGADKGVVLGLVLAI